MEESSKENNEVRTNLEENLCLSKLEVCVLEDGFADLERRCSAVFHVGGADPHHQDTVAVDELAELVSDWITGATDADRLHHTRVTQLTAAQLTIKHLKNSENDEIPNSKSKQ